MGPHPISSLGFKRNERGRWGNRNELEPRKVAIFRWVLDCRCWTGTRLRWAVVLKGQASVLNVPSFTPQ